MRHLRLVLPSLAALALAASCTVDTPMGPSSPGGVPLLDVSGAGAAGPVAFCNPATITINQAGAATPYPSLMTVTGIPSGPIRVTATLNGISHTATGDIDMLLVGPGGQNVMLMSDAGGSANLQNATLTFDDNATAQLPSTSTTVIPGGTYKPTNFGTGDFFQGLTGPFGASFAVFGGTDPNGTWRLYIWDDITFEAGSIASGWCVNITALGSVPVANAGGPYTVVEGSPMTFDGTGSTDADNDIVSYAWTFGDGATGTGPTPAHTYEVMGTYPVTLVVTDAQGATANATTSVTVLNEPGTPESFCNAAPITIRDANSALPYPSTIAVSGVSAGSFKVTVTVKGINHQTLLDLDMLLAGPAGQTVMLMSDADGGADLQNATLTFDDDASTQIPATNLGILPSGSYRPTNVGSPDAMPAGAPAEPYGSSLAVFAGTNPNGTWSLFLRDDTILGGGTGSVTRGWCVNLAQTNAAPVANAGGPYSGAEGSPIDFDGTGSTDPDNNIASYAWNFGDGETGSGPTIQHTYANGGTYTVTLTVTDADGASDVATAPVTVTNVAPVVTSVALPSDPVAVNAPVALGATFADAGTGDSHTGSFTLGAGGPVAPGVVVETNGSGSMSASVTFTQAGVYTITATVTDDDGGTGVRSSAVDVPAFVVVYDPTGSFVTGGGWISSPAGAYAAEPTFTGKASFGFVAKYKPGASTPSGNTEFQFKAGDLSFKSTSYEWLVVAGAHAKFKGEGTINGAGSYGFMVTAVDGDGPGGGDEDAFRIKIWNLATGAIVYDNKIGEGDESAAATSLGGGSIVIHK